MDPFVFSHLLSMPGWLEERKTAGRNRKSASRNAKKDGRNVRKLMLAVFAKRKKTSENPQGILHGGF